jgi:hypothetical protein
MDSLNGVEFLAHDVAIISSGEVEEFKSKIRKIMGY